MVQSRQPLQTAVLRRGAADRNGAPRLTYNALLRKPCDLARDVRVCAASDNNDGDNNVDIDELARRLSSEAQRMREGSDAESREPPTPPVSWTQASGISVPVSHHPLQKLLYRYSSSARRQADLATCSKEFHNACRRQYPQGNCLGNHCFRPMTLSFIAS